MIILLVLTGVIQYVYFLWVIAKGAYRWTRASLRMAVKGLMAIINLGAIAKNKASRLFRGLKR